MRRPFCPLVLGLCLLATPTLAATPTHLWSRTFGSSTVSEQINGVAFDAAGNVIVTGAFGGTINLGGSDIVSAGAEDIFLAKYTANGLLLWSKGIGSTSTDEGLGVAVDASGNIVLAGDFSGTVDFGSGGQPSAGNLDIFFAKYYPDGSLNVVKTFGSTLTDRASCLTIDASGSIYVGGYFQGTVDFGSGTGLVSAGGFDAFLAKYSSFGTHQWSRSFGSTGADLVNAIALDAAGSSVIFTGQFANTVNFGGSNLTSFGSSDAFLVKFTSTPLHVWSQRYGGTLNDSGNSVAVDGSGNVFMCGSFAGTGFFGGSNLVSAGSFDAILAKYNSAGTHQWSQRFGGAGSDFATDIALDAAANIVMTGGFSNSASFGGGTLVNTGAGTDVFLAQYNSGGTHQWSQRFGGTVTDDGISVALDNAGDVSLTGRYSNGADFGAGLALANGTYDLYFAKFDRRAAEPVITAITDIGNDQGRRVQIKFTASGGDNVDATTPVTAYEAYRKQKAPPAAAASGDLRALDIGWTFVGSVPAHQKSEYSIEAPTIGDTTIPLGTYNSEFFIRAASDGSVFYDSPPDSGASVDNLAPGIPGSFIYTSGNLTWNESEDEDFDYFTVYGSNTNSLGGATVVNYTVAPAMNVSASPYAWYFVTATDFNGNEGKAARVNSLSGVGGTPSSYVLSVSNYPNPFNPRTTVNYTVPSRGHVSVSVYDARGAHVAMLFDGERNAGAYSIEWDGRTKNGDAVASGLYFARIEHNGATRTKKMVLLK